MKKNTWVPAPNEYEAQTSRLKQAISVNAETLIHGLQPYHRGAAFNQDPLWILSELDNAYKHRLLLLTVHSVSNYWVTITSRGQTIKAAFQPNIRFEDGAEIGRIVIDDSTFSLADSDVCVDGDLAVAIAFNEVIDRENVPVITCLTQLADCVSGIVDRLTAEFG